MNRLFSGKITFNEVDYLYVRARSANYDLANVYILTADFFLDSSKTQPPVYSSFKTTRIDSVTTQEFVGDIEAQAVHARVSQAFDGVGKKTEQLSADGILYVFTSETFTKKINAYGEVTTLELLGDTVGAIVGMDFDSIPKKHPGLKYQTGVTVYTSDESILNSLYSMAEIQRNTGKDFGWLKNKKYGIINTIEEFQWMIRELEKLPKDWLVGFDTETTGLKFNCLDPDSQYRDKLVGLVISWEDNTGYYIPVAHRFFKNLDVEYVVDELRRFLDVDSDEKLCICTHNGKFDWKVMFSVGIDLYIAHDSYILKYMFDNRFTKSKAKLKELIYAECGIEAIELYDFLKDKSMDIDFSYLPYDSVYGYAPSDADHTRMLVQMYLTKIPRKMIHLYAIEIMLMPWIGHSEFFGTAIDLKKMKVAELSALAAEHEKKIELFQFILDNVSREYKYLIADCLDSSGQLNPDYVQISKLIDSPKKLGILLFDAFRYPVVATTKTGNPATSKMALRLLSSKRAEDGTIMYPMAAKILDYRKIVKQITGFYKSIKTVLRGNRLFPEFKQTGTESGRLSAVKPNLQNQDNAVKKLFVALPGHYVFDGDLSQIEYRVMGSEAQEPLMLMSLADPDADFHTEVASVLFDIPASMVTGTLRKVSKALNFGIPYGMGGESLGFGIHDTISAEATADGNAKRALYFERYPKLKKFFEDVQREVATRFYTEGEGYVETKFYRKRILIDSFAIGDKDRINAGIRKAGNTKIQGTAADIFKRAYVRFMKLLRKNGLTAINPETGLPFVWIIGNVHDELIVHVHNSVSPFLLVSLMKLAFEVPIEGYCPIFLGMSIGDSWGTAKDGLEIPNRLGNKVLKQFQGVAFEAGEEELPMYETDPMYTDFFNFEGNAADEFITRVIAFQELHVKMHLQKLGYAVDGSEVLHTRDVFNKYDDYKQRFWITKYLITGNNDPDYKKQYIEPTPGVNTKKDDANVLFIAGLRRLLDKWEIPYIDDWDPNNISGQSMEDLLEDDEVEDEDDIEDADIVITDKAVLGSTSKVLSDSLDGLGSINYVEFSAGTYEIDCSKIREVSKSMKLVAHLKALHVPSGSCPVMFKTNMGVRDSKVRVESLDRNSINELLGEEADVTEDVCV